MNPQDGAKRHNKLATYGRGSRKTPSTHSPFSPQIVLDDGEDISGVLEKKKLSRLRTYGSGRQASLGRKVHQSLSPSRIEVPVSKSLFDLPSSDSEDDAYSRSRGGSKKRKLEYQSTIVAQEGVYDDESLQRHIAAEAQRDQENLQPFPRLPKSSKPKSSNSAAQQTTARNIDRAVRTQKPKSTTSLGSHTSLKKTALPAGPVIPQFPKKQQKSFISQAMQDPTPISLPSPSPEKVAEILPVPPAPVLHHASLARKVPAVGTIATAMKKSLVKSLRPLPSTSSQSVQASWDQAPPNNRSHRGKVTAKGRPHTPDTVVGTTSGNVSPNPRVLPQHISESVHLNSPSTIGIQGIQLSSPEAPIDIHRKGSQSTSHASLKKLEFAPALVRPRKRIIDRLFRHSSCSSTNSEETKEGDTSSDSEVPSAHSSASTPMQGVSNDAALEKPIAHCIALEDNQDTQQTSKSSQPTYSSTKVTYQHQRSYLTEEMVDEADLFKIPILPDPVLEKPSRRSRTNRKIPGLPRLSTLQQSFEIEEGLDDTTAGPTRNIHELRQAGGNARLLGSMEAMLDDIDPNKGVSLSTRRSGLLDLYRSLAQSASCQAFIDHGLVDQLFASFDKSLDEVTGVLVMSCFATVLNQQCPVHLLLLINQSRVFEFLTSRLESIEDFKGAATRRRSNLSRVMQHEILDLSDSLLASSIWTDISPSYLTARSLSLHCLEIAVRHLREAGCTIDVLSQEVISSLVGIAAPAANAIKTSLDPALHIGSFDFCQAISILEYTTTSSQTIETHETTWTTDSMEQTSQLLPMLCNKADDESGKAQLLILRLCLNLTNGSGSACKVFSKPEIVRTAIAIALRGFNGLYKEEDADSHTILLDTVVLGLGLLINLAESSDAARLQFISESDGNTTSLDNLLQLFTSNVARASEVVSERDSQSNVAFGYLSVLLAHLSLSRPIRQRVKSRLQGATLKPLLTAVGEFLEYNRRVTDQIIQQGEQEVDLKAGFLGRLQELLEQLHGA